MPDAANDRFEPKGDTLLLSSSQLRHPAVTLGQPQAALEPDVRLVRSED